MIRLGCEPGGPRATEIVTLPAALVDLRRDLVTVTGKGNRTRVFPLGIKAAQALTRYGRARGARADAHRHPQMFLGKQGPLTRSGFLQILRRRCAQAGVPHMHPHQLRHFAADACKRDGFSDDEMMQLFGWNSRAMPAVYGRAAAAGRAIDIAREKNTGDQL
jgi:site-specific recombinase XerD